MAVTSVKERRSAANAHRPRIGIREYTRNYVVTTDDPATGPRTVLAATGVPRVLDSYGTATETDDEAVVVTRRIRQNRNSALHWNVEINYSTDADKRRMEASRENPLDAPPTIIFGFERFRVIAIDGFLVTGTAAETRSAIVNSSKQPFDPPPMKDESRPVLTVIRNEQFFASATAVGFQDAVNDDAFAGAEEGQVKVQNITATQQIDPANPDFEFWRVTYSFAFKKEGWSLKLLDHGTRVVDPDDISLFVPYTEDGVVTDILLNGNAGKNAAGAADVFLEYEVYDKKDFAELGLNELLGEALEPDPPAQP